MNREQKEARGRICYALDYKTTQEALNAVEKLSNFVGLFKVGKQLHTAACNAGIPIVDKIQEAGAGVFLDLKFHDTPQTVGKAVKAAVHPVIQLVDVHISGGEEMCKKALREAKNEAEKQGVNPPKIIGVTVLTSLDSTDLREVGCNNPYDELVQKRTEVAFKWGLDGIVCPANKAGKLEDKYGDDLLYVTPGIKSKGVHGTGQKQLYTPDKAVRNCNNSILIIGSAIRKADEPRAVAKRIMNTVTQNI